MEQNKGLNRTKLVIGGHRGHKSDVRENTIANFEQIKGLVFPISRLMFN